MKERDLGKIFLFTLFGIYDGVISVSSWYSVEVNIEGKIVFNVINVSQEITRLRTEGEIEVCRVKRIHLFLVKAAFIGKCLIYSVIAIL